MASGSAASGRDRKRQPGGTRSCAASRQAEVIGQTEDRQSQKHGNPGKSRRTAAELKMFFYPAVNQMAARKDAVRADALPPRRYSMVMKCET